MLPCSIHLYLLNVRHSERVPVCSHAGNALDEKPYRRIKLISSFASLPTQAAFLHALRSDLQL